MESHRTQLLAESLNKPLRIKDNPKSEALADLKFYGEWSASKEGLSFIPKDIERYKGIIQALLATATGKTFDDYCANNPAPKGDSPRTVQTFYLIKSEAENSLQDAMRSKNSSPTPDNRVARIIEQKIPDPQSKATLDPIIKKLNNNSSLTKEFHGTWGVNKEGHLAFQADLLLGRNKIPELQTFLTQTLKISHLGKLTNSVVINPSSIDVLKTHLGMPSIKVGEEPKAASAPVSPTHKSKIAENPRSSLIQNDKEREPTQKSASAPASPKPR